VENTSLTVTVTANDKILNVAGGFYAASTDTGAHSALTAPGPPGKSGAAGFHQRPRRGI